MRLIGPRRVDADQDAPLLRQVVHTPSVMRRVVSSVWVQLVLLVALTLTGFATCSARNESGAQSSSRAEWTPQ